MKEIETILLELTGVLAVSQISISDRGKIVELESDYEKNGMVGLQNLGIRMILECSMVYAILKDISFRPPPCPTIFMVEDINEDEELSNHILNIGNKRYHIVGEEIIDKKFPAGEKFISISDDFILYPGRRNDQTKKPAYFLIPPIAFNELEIVRDSYKIRNIMSVSPSTMSDEYIRESCAFSPGKDLATILIGFDTQE